MNLLLLWFVATQPRYINMFRSTSVAEKNPINPKLLKMIDSTLVKIKTVIFVKHKLQRK